MNDSVKSISLDDIGEIPNPLGMGGSSDKTRNKALHYNPQYGDLGTAPPPMASQRMTSSVSEHDSKFSLTSTLTRFSEILGPIKGSGSSKRSPLLMGGVVALVVAVGAYFYMDSEGMFAGGSEAPHEEAPVEASDSSTLDLKAPHSGKNTAAKDATLKGPEEVKTDGKSSVMVVEEIAGNAYWKLPNPVATPSEAPSSISSQQTEQWRAGLAHPFSYQRFHTVQEMRKGKADGSASILYEALAQPKFWTRMEAILSLAEQGISIDNESMKAAIGDARSDLVRNYFRRFKSNPNDVSSHVLREALRVVDGNSRFVILNQLAAHRSETNDMYLIAALNDTDPQTKAFASATLEVRPALETSRLAYEKAMSETAVIVEAPLRKKAGTLDVKVEKIPANLNVEEVYFINDEEAPVEAPKPKIEDDGFNDLNHQNHHTEAH